MPIVQSVFASSRDPRLAAQLADLATSAAPAWLWTADGAQILWTNAVGAAIFGAAGPDELATRRFEGKHPAAAEIARLAVALAPGGQARLERLRGFGASFGVALTCLCSRFAANGGPAAVLVVATDQAGPALTLRERASRLFSGRTEPFAVFTPDGALLHANAAALPRIGGAATLSALGIVDGASQALKNGSADQATGNGVVAIERLGSEASTVLVVSFEKQNSEASATERVATKTETAFLPTAQSAVSAALPSSPMPRNPAPDEAIAERRYPLRFVWQMDADGRFVIGSDEFIELMGPRTTAAFGRLWNDIAAELDLDRQNQVARAVATHETWSGITVSWPVNEGSERLPVELSGLPVFDRERVYRGYRGFGVCREVTRINQLARARRERSIGFMAQPEAMPEGSKVAAPIPQSVPAAAVEGEAASAPAEAVPMTSLTEQPVPSVAPAANVVPFRPGASPEPKAPSLSPVERKAFRELAQELTARLQGAHEPSVGGDSAAEKAQADHEQAGAHRPRIPPAFEPVLLDRIPLGVLIYRDGELLYANRYFLELSGYQNLDALAAVGGLDALFAEPDAGALAASGGARSLSVMTAGGERRPIEGRLFTVPWAEASALALILTNGEAEARQSPAGSALASAENEIRSLKTKLESFNRSDTELRAATREAQKATAAKAEFIGKVSHAIRTPLNTTIGFAEVIMAERFGPIGNERYREYLKDIHAAGMHLVSLLNDLLDLSKVESGERNLTFANVSLNELTQQCVGIMQPQASRARIIIRTSLTPGLPQVVADERSLRQIVLNLLSNSIRFTGPGGQVIVSTAFADSGEAVLRVRDTGTGMSEKDVEAALEPFRQTATSGEWGSAGTGLRLPLTKALAEANRAHFSIKSAPNAGTLIEVAFPPTRVVAR
jgi:signal transduction histidine kinase